MMKVRNKSCRERQNAQRKGTGSMISYIKGTLEAVEEDMIIVETGGIGYGIRVPLSLLEELPSLGSPVIVHTYFQVREDSMTLYGFLNRQDREMFKQLISVNGIGPRGALGILSVMRPDDLRTAIVSGDAKAISRAPGIGPKTAQRLILDLKDKVDRSTSCPGCTSRTLAISVSVTISRETSPVSYLLTLARLLWILSASCCSVICLFFLYLRICAPTYRFTCSTLFSSPSVFILPSPGK